jgi:GNAT superfamily N-acetyltransferase
MSESSSPARDVHVREIHRDDYDGWRPLWDGYNEFYGRHGATALPEPVTASLWQRFFDPAEPVHGLVAMEPESNHIVGLTHYLFHRSTTRLEPICYLQDLFTVPDRRGQGIGRMLIEAVYDRARAAGARRVYWQTHETNAPGRLLYDKLAQHHGFIVYSHDL